jgi:hypothetical protein
MARSIIIDPVPQSLAALIDATADASAVAGEAANCYREVGRKLDSPMTAALRLRLADRDADQTAADIERQFIRAQLAAEQLRGELAVLSNLVQFHRDRVRRTTGDERREAATGSFRI